MSRKTKASSGQGKALETFVIGIGKVVWFILQIAWHGMWRTVFRSVDQVLALVMVYGVTFLMVFWDFKHLVLLNWLFPGVFNETVLRFLIFHVPQWFQFLALAGFSTVALGVFLGSAHFFKMRRFQSDLRHMGLKSATGLEPRVVDVQSVGEFKRKVTLASQGVGIDQYKSKKSDLESTFGAIVEDICTSARGRKFIELHLVDKELPQIIGYPSWVDALTEPYSFVIGESLSGILTQSIRTLPHLIVAGTSGFGKSMFFNQSLISFLRTSPHIQLYLLDLKLGVEVQEYGDLPNVRIAKDDVEAVQLLKAVVKEMKARFELLAKIGKKQIEPERDAKDLILVGVDEASVLFGKRRGKSSANEMSNLARELTDEIAKLGRAASIHLVIATQKVTNESIDTRVQENVGGRICFRVATLQGSNTVLGNKKANELPDVKGRAIWAHGNKFIEVQTPFLSEGDIDRELKGIKSDFESGKRKCLQEMLRPREVDRQPDGVQSALGKEQP